MQPRQHTLRELYEDIVMLICECRFDVNAGNGRLEAGPHCPPSKPLGPPGQHNCDARSPVCQQALDMQRRAARLSQRRLPLCLCVCLAPKCCESTGLVLERWTLYPNTSDQSISGGMSVHPALLLNAVRSHLAFSQYSAWLTKHNTKLNCRTIYRVCLPGEIDDKTGTTFARSFDQSELEHHQFPHSKLPCGTELSVSLASLARQSEPPVISCLCQTQQQQPKHTPPPVVGKTRQQPSSATSWKAYSTLDSIPVVLAQPSPVTTTATSAASPIAANPSASNPLFLSHQPPDHWLYRTPPPAAASSAQLPPPVRPSRLDTERLRDRSPTADVSDDATSPVQFYLESPGSAGSGSSDPAASWSAAKRDDDDDAVDKRSQQPGGSGRTMQPFNRRSRNVSKKILFSSDAAKYEPAEAEDRTDEVLADLRLDQPLHKPRAHTTGHHGHSQPSTSHQLQSTSTSTSATSSSAAAAPPAPSVRRMPFSSIGLPLTSSPAPLKRNKYSFDYDATLNTVAGLKSAFYHEHYDSGSSDSELDCGPLCKSAPASTNLLGNFEESALNGRIKPNGLLDGFKLELAASGAFCPAHVQLPVRTSFFNVSHDDAPSPYLGTCQLGPPALSKKGYHVPRRGNVQATLFNPNGTVVKMFVVRYDLSDMPAHSQTFVRQRTFCMPRQAAQADARAHPHWLRYLIHLRFATSRSGRLYIHTDIRMLFSRKSEIESLDVEPPTIVPSQQKSKPTTTPLTAVGHMDLRSYTEMPRNPKYSPRKGAQLWSAGPDSDNID